MLINYAILCSRECNAPVLEDTNGAPKGAIGGADRAADLGSALRSRRRVPAPAKRVHVRLALAKWPSDFTLHVVAWGSVGFGLRSHQGQAPASIVARTEFVTRASYRGSTSASQAENAGSIPVARSQYDPFLRKVR
jgi:hypothetical protein